MGLTMHFSGRFNEKASLSEMIEEVKDIVEVYQWKYDIYETRFPSGSLGKKTYNDKIYGISITPPECETVGLTFLSNGRMSNGALLKFWGKSKDREHQKYLYMPWVKTQFAGQEIHKIIVRLLKYISKKYLKDFEVMDEGKYWETGDEKLLAEIFRDYEDLFDTVSYALQNIPIKRGETLEQYFNRILKKSRSKK